jgi:hypothetical protein
LNVEKMLLPGAVTVLALMFSGLSLWATLEKYEGESSEVMEVTEMASGQAEGMVPVSSSPPSLPAAATRVQQQQQQQAKQEHQ